MEYNQNSAKACNQVEESNTELEILVNKLFSNNAYLSGIVGRLHGISERLKPQDPVKEASGVENPAVPEGIVGSLSTGLYNYGRLIDLLLTSVSRLETII